MRVYFVINYTGAKNFKISQHVNNILYFIVKQKKNDFFLFSIGTAHLSHIRMDRRV